VDRRLPLRSAADALGLAVLLDPRSAAFATLVSVRLSTTKRSYLRSDSLLCQSLADMRHSA
jgi:hypothetical protein